MPSVLSSWKEIAQFMGTSVRTVQRWEQEGKLRVYRPSPYVVLAFPLELQHRSITRLDTDQVRRMRTTRQWLGCNRERMHRNMKRLSTLRTHVVSWRERLQSLRARLNTPTRSDGHI